MLPECLEASCFFISTPGLCDIRAAGISAAPKSPSQRRPSFRKQTHIRRTQLDDFGRRRLPTCPPPRIQPHKFPGDDCVRRTKRLCNARRWRRPSLWPRQLAGIWCSPGRLSNWRRNKQDTSRPSSHATTSRRSFAVSQCTGKCEDANKFGARYGGKEPSGCNNPAFLEPVDGLWKRRLGLPSASLLRTQV